jgi:DNA-binding MarR family transcriptional regulator
MTKAERFAALISEVAREVSRRRASDACCGDLTLEQFEMLRLVAALENATMGSLAAGLQVDLSTTSRNVSVLERRTYLQRVRSAEDGRLVHVRLTAKGRAALETLSCGERAVLGSVFGRIPSGSRASVMTTLELLRDCLAERDQACCEPESDVRAAPTRVSRQR